MSNELSLVEHVYNSIPKNPSYATTLNFWTTIILLFFNLPSKRFREILETISFGILVTGSYISSDNLENVYKIVSPENIIQHILPYTLYKYHNLKLLHSFKMVKLISICMIVKIYLVYLNYKSENNPEKIYKDINGNVKMTILSMILYILLNK